MNDKESSGCVRKLVYIPIVHTLADMGTLGASIQSAKLAALGRQGLARSAAQVERIWEEIERAVGTMPVSPGSTRVYQDGLPVCGREREIVVELAQAGSRNHKLLLSLEARGAALMGTESPELLVEEYRLANATWAAGRPSHTRVRPNRSGGTLLERRDRYVAERIDQTLGAGETGILFMGMLHEVAKYLNSNIEVTYPLGRPRIGQRRGV
jgi:hypothetical protein